jgi:hypothetical protein
MLAAELITAHGQDDDFMALVDESFQRALRANLQPLNDYSAARTAMAFSDLNRARQLQDVTEASKRRINEQSEVEKNRLVSILVGRGIKANTGMSFEDLAEKVRESDQAVAENVFEALSIEKKQIADRRAANLKSIDDLYETGTTDRQKLAALKETLDDPAVVASMKEKDRSALLMLLDSKADPERLVKDAFDKIESNKRLFWGAGGEAKAQYFRSAYTDRLHQNLSETKQLRLTAAFEDQKNVDRQEQTLNQKSLDAWTRHGSVLPKAKLDKIRTDLLGDHPAAVVQAATVKQKLKQAGKDTGQTPTTPVAATAPPTFGVAESLASIPGLIRRTIESGTAPDASLPRRMLAGALMPVTSWSGAPTVVKDWWTGGAARASQPATPKQELDFRMARDERTGQAPTNRPAVPTPAEAEAVKQLARTRYAQSDADIEAGDKLIREGNLNDPRTRNAIIAYQYLLREVRTGRPGMPAVRAPGSAVDFPSNAPIGLQ